MQFFALVETPFFFVYVFLTQTQKQGVTNMKLRLLWEQITQAFLGSGTICICFSIFLMYNNVFAAQALRLSCLSVTSLSFEPSFIYIICYNLSSVLFTLCAEVYTVLK